MRQEAGQIEGRQRKKTRLPPTGMPLIRRTASPNAFQALGI